MLPKLYRWDNRRSSVWAFGWLVGKDNDLVCVKPNITNEIAAEMSLSPVDLPPENVPSINVRLDIKKGGYFIGQKTIQTRANHQQAP